MVAAAFKGILVFRTSQRNITNSIAATDVADAYVTYEDGQSVLQLPSGEGTVALTDVQLTAAGTDTSKMLLYVNGKLTDKLVLNAGNLTTNIARQVLSAPIYLAAGAQIRLQQKA